MEFTKEQKLHQDVINQAWRDESFKKELMANPLAAIEKFTGVKLEIPAGKTIVVRDQSDQSTVYINIPEEQDLGDVELNEEQLEAVAGGTDMVSVLKDRFICPFPPKGCFPPNDSFKGLNDTF